MRSRRVALAIATCCAALTTAPLSAHAAGDFSPLPARTLGFAAHGTSAAPCTTRAAAGAHGIATVTYTAPAEGFASFGLDGGERHGDWDLAVFDARSGVRLGASQAFGASELVQTWMRSGQQVVLQACRRAGAVAHVPGRVQYGVAAWPAIAPPVKLVRIPLTNTRRQVPVLMALGIDVDENVYPDHALATVDSAADIGKLVAAGFAPKVLIGDVLASDRATIATDRARASRTRSRLRAAGNALPSGRTTYRQYEDYQSDLKNLVAAHPGLVRPITLPVKSFQGRDQMGIEISDKVDATDDQKPTAFIMGVHHAREWPAGEIPMEFAIYLAQHFGNDARVTKLLKSTRIVIVPIINPDGFIASRTAVDPADSLGDPGGALSLGESAFPPGGTLAYRRKTCDGAIPSGAAPCILQYGIDPNRNYGFNWGGPGASSSPLSQSYRGTGQWSEPETRSVHQFSQTRDVTSLLTMHNFASLVLRPPGLKTDGQAPDEDALKRLGDAMSADTGYKSEYGYELYDTAGTTEDWNYGAAGTFGYTIEMGPASGDGGNFHVAYQRAVIDQFNGAGQQAGRGLRQALLELSEEATNTADFATFRGRTLPGRILHLHKAFQTSTSPICAIAGPVDLNLPFYSCLGTTAATSVGDFLDYKTKVGPSGKFVWLVTPSTRPFVHKKGMSEAWTLTCEDTAGKVYVTKQITLWRGETRKLSLPCGGKLPKLRR